MQSAHTSLPGRTQIQVKNSWLLLDNANQNHWVKKGQKPTAKNDNLMFQNRSHNAVALFYVQNCLVFGSFLASGSLFLHPKIEKTMFSQFKQSLVEIPNVFNFQSFWLKQFKRNKKNIFSEKNKQFLNFGRKISDVKI